ncbi:hypothetical protein LF01B1_01770 [Limosilactobacillus fermentum]|uniref:Uncharacterized protein n=1 Tax=Limosilactobacillus fermentum TaxID=1613 RepID=A0ABD0AJQ5_LIMFE|nr:hypothetical protein LF01B1_01770 [Limosilactobacillus fermentum]
MGGSHEADIFQLLVVVIQGDGVHPLASLASVSSNQKVFVHDSHSFVSFITNNSSHRFNTLGETSCHNLTS